MVEVILVSAITGTISGLVGGGGREQVAIIPAPTLKKTVEELEEKIGQLRKPVETEFRRLLAVETAIDSA